MAGQVGSATLPSRSPRTAYLGRLADEGKLRSVVSVRLPLDQVCGSPSNEPSRPRPRQDRFGGFKTQQAAKSAVAARPQRVEHGTGQRGVVGAAGESLRQDALEPAEVGQLRSHLVEMPLRYFSHLDAGAVRRLGEGEQGPDILDTEAKLTGAADEGQPADVSYLVGAVAACSARGFGMSPMRS